MVVLTFWGYELQQRGIKMHRSFSHALRLTMHERTHPPSPVYLTKDHHLSVPCQDIFLFAPPLSHSAVSRDLGQPYSLSLLRITIDLYHHITKMDFEDDDAFLYGESSPPPQSAATEPVKVETDSKPDVVPTRSSFLS
jgi:hypothetical protein